MRSALSILLAMVVLFVLILDGASVYAADKTADDVAQSAAQKAALAFVGSRGDEGIAGKAASDYVHETNGELVQIQYHHADYRWYEAKVRVEPTTRVLHLVPFAGRVLVRVSTAVVQF